MFSISNKHSTFYFLIYIIFFCYIFFSPPRIPASPFELDSDLVPCAVEQVYRLLVCYIFGLGAADFGDDVPSV